MKKLSKWVTYELTKNSCCEVSSSLILPNNNEPFLNRIVTCNKKGTVYEALAVLGSSRSSKALPKAKFAPRKGSGHWWSTVGLIHYSFLNPGEMITPEKYTQQINETHRELQPLQLALINRKSPILLHNTGFRSGTNWATEFCLICHIHLTPCQPTNHFFKQLDKFLQGNCFHNQQEAENAF